MSQDEMNNEENGFDAGVGQGEAPPIEGLQDPYSGDANMPPPIPPIEKPAVGGIAGIAARLSQKEGGDSAEKTESGAQAATPAPFDLSKMTLEQMQELKAMLSSTPDGAVKKNFKPTVKLRRIAMDLGEGNVEEKLVIDFGKAYKTEMRDLEQNRMVQVDIIPVMFLGDKEMKPVVFNKFVNSEQVVCEVLSQRSVENIRKEGTTHSRETGTLVEMVVKEIKQFFTVKLPAGSAVESIEIEARVANG